MEGGKEVVGRDAELAQIVEALDGLRERGAVLHLVGEPGVGKTEVLHAATREAAERQLPVLSVRGVSAESHLSFAALHVLLRPLLDRVEALPAEHRSALLGAFGLVANPRAHERLFVSLAALELLADAAAECPLVVVVDDLPWMDNASREAIEFVARRIDGEPLLCLLASRSGPGSQEAEPVGSVVRVAPLDASASRRLLRNHAPGLTAAEEEVVLDAAAGNPLALLELPLAIASRGSAVRSSSSAVPLTARLERAFAVRLDDLRPATRTTLLVAALQDSDRLAETASAVALLAGKGGAHCEFSAAVDAGLVTLDGETFRFRHPLVRSAIARTASVEMRTRIHTAFARSLAAEPDRATWHRAMATSAPDEALAADLVAGAERAIARGAPDTAEEWVERAAELSPDPSRRAQRLVRAAELAFELGRQEAVHARIAQARSLELDPADYARLARLEGAFDDGTPGDEDNVRLLVDAAGRALSAGERDVAASLLLGAAMPCYWGGAADEVRAHVRRGTAEIGLPESDPRAMVLRALIDPFAEAPRLVEELRNWAGRDTTDFALASALARTGFVIGEFERAVTFAGRACEGLRTQGRVALLTQALVLETFAALYLGRWDVTSVSSDEAYRFATETRQPVWQACARLGQANLAGLQGNEARALEFAAEVEQTALASNNRSLLNGVQLARGFTALGARRPADAFNEFRRMFDVDDVAYQLPQTAFAVDYLAEAAQLAGHATEARQALDALEDLVGETPSSGVGRAVTLARALLTDDEDAEAAFETVRRSAASTTPWYRARVDLAYGAWLRRQRRVSEARKSLAAAQTVFEGLGAHAWASRAREERAATGQHPRRREPDAWAQLSPQELQIAQLAAQGLSNREIGQRLYLSHRTVASHLYRLFPKLGVTSRAQLHLALPDIDTTT